MKSLYIISEGPDGPVKIGVCEHILRRLKMLQVGNPRELKMVMAFLGAWSVERPIHAELARFRLCGEWFDISENDAKESVRKFLRDKSFKFAEVDYSKNNYDEAGDNFDGTA